MEKCLFSITIQRSIYAGNKSSFAAQTELKRAFSHYYSNIFRNLCVTNTAVTSRTKFLQPLVITCFDVEGSRFNNRVQTTSNPHYHGIVLFHHRTIDLFLHRMRGRLQDDGTYRITHPFQTVQAIHLERLTTEPDVATFLHYSTKHCKFLRGNHNNYSSFDVYPFKSSYFPFWEYYRDLPTTPHGVEHSEPFYGFPPPLGSTAFSQRL